MVLSCAAKKPPEIQFFTASGTSGRLPAQPKNYAAQCPGCLPHLPSTRSAAAHSILSSTTIQIKKMNTNNNQISFFQERRSPKLQISLPNKKPTFHVVRATVPMARKRNFAKAICTCRRGGKLFYKRPPSPLQEASMSNPRAQTTRYLKFLPIIDCSCENTPN